MVHILRNFPGLDIYDITVRLNLLNIRTLLYFDELYGQIVSEGDDGARKL